VGPPAGAGRLTRSNSCFKPSVTEISVASGNVKLKHVGSRVHNIGGGMKNNIFMKEARLRVVCFFFASLHERVK